MEIMVNEIIINETDAAMKAAVGAGAVKVPVTGTFGEWEYEYSYRWGRVLPDGSREYLECLWRYPEETVWHQDWCQEDAEGNTFAYYC